jgi:hypothetical protein
MKKSKTKQEQKQKQKKNIIKTISIYNNKYIKLSKESNQY